MTTPDQGGAAPEPGWTPEPVPEPAGPAENATPAGAKDGLVRCARCGATDVAYRPETGTLVCEFCRYEWTEARLDEAMGLSEGIADLRGRTLSTASADITDDETLMTFKCSGCGAEVVVDTARSLQARCHWCKHVLSINNRIPNGAVPDGILPFSVTREQAMESISAFVAKRKSFAHPEFEKTFRPENVMGVYIPYMTVDGKVTARLDGVGEIGRGRVKVGENNYEYKVDRYAVARELDLEIDDVIVETSASKADIHATESTNNIINSILPFDVKNIVRFNASFLGDEYTSERRDMDVDHADDAAYAHMLTIARGSAAASVGRYDRGVRWEQEQLSVTGTRWTSVLLPVWLYGFEEKGRHGSVTHYLAVNGRSRATMGSVPINTSKARRVAFGVAAAASVVTWPIAFLIMRGI
ncbi:TFIIB-type zinc ribbon-containing protein [Demequina sp. SYSU T00039]|uniref:TFIIB-type zinc ribbon-containing protein n=1 Tax=Demequina lignilytica TaxID=3051663 RepID=A0AAW7M0A8_9MICO|nr:MULTISPECIES: TFIIB-type zinc ribbon-containing protein [unclassified Demequina]MDN4479261.1 TFIIB-type zinc ribbon-containing protein [Demequina sp. SYSU T00039-1]MDN4487579.1 TFIIB-type zinc ribbon-containing protein [Demequina sp. SYSU T00039]